MREGRPRGRPFRFSLPASGRGKESKMPEHAPTTLSQAIGRGLACRCPRCGAGKLYAGFLSLRPACERCGLDYGFIDSGDGPAVFVILLAGFIAVGCALVVEVK